MKSFLLAAKISAVFLVVMGIFVAVTLHLFVSMVMRPVTHGDLHGARRGKDQSDGLFGWTLQVHLPVHRSGKGESQGDSGPFEPCQYRPGL